jgi:hypothetical protein
MSRFEFYVENKLVSFGYDRPNMTVEILLLELDLNEGFFYNVEDANHEVIASSLNGVSFGNYQEFVMVVDKLEELGIKIPDKDSCLSIMMTNSRDRYLWNNELERWICSN